MEVLPENKHLLVLASKQEKPSNCGPSGPVKTQEVSALGLFFSVIVFTGSYV
jgi:hypothetical protein